jgi:hypothetical protein
MPSQFIFSFNSQIAGLPCFKVSKTLSKFSFGKALLIAVIALGVGEMAAIIFFCELVMGYLLQSKIVPRGVDILIFILLKSLFVWVKLSVAITLIRKIVTKNKQQIIKKQKRLRLAKVFENPFSDIKTPLAYY